MVHASPLPKGLLLALTLGLATASGPCYAQGSLEEAAGDTLYSATTIVTGQDNLAERRRGLRTCLLEVLSKVSGHRFMSESDTYLAGLDQIDALTKTIAYRDRKEGIQISDEQGTRDRSFFFTAGFEETGINNLLSRSGYTPWLSHRPKTRIRLEIDDGTARYLLTRTSKRGWGQRAVIDSLQDKMALHFVLPEERQTADHTASGERTVVDLSGSMSVTKEGYWSSHWQIDSGSDPASSGQETGWDGTVGTFDHVLAEALWKTSEILSQRRR